MPWYFDETPPTPEELKKIQDDMAENVERKLVKNRLEGPRGQVQGLNNAQAFVFEDSPSMPPGFEVTLTTVFVAVTRAGEYVQYLGGFSWVVTFTKNGNMTKTGIDQIEPIPKAKLEEIDKGIRKK